MENSAVTGNSLPRASRNTRGLVWPHHDAHQKWQLEARYKCRPRTSKTILHEEPPTRKTDSVHQNAPLRIAVVPGASSPLESHKRLPINSNSNMVYLEGFYFQSPNNNPATSRMEKRMGPSPRWDKMQSATIQPTTGEWFKVRHSHGGSYAKMGYRRTNQQPTHCTRPPASL